MKRLYPLSLAAVMFGMALGSTAALAQSYPPGPPPGAPGYNHPPPPHPAPPPTHVVVINHPAPPTHVVVINHPAPPPERVVVINHPAPPPTHVVVVNRPPPPGNWHQWHQGDHYTGNRVVVYNYSQYRLRQPPPGYQWVQDGGQFVLIAVATGIVADIILNSASQ